MIQIEERSARGLCYVRCHVHVLVEPGAQVPRRRYRGNVHLINSDAAKTAVCSCQSPETPSYHRLTSTYRPSGWRRGGLVVSALDF